MIFKTITRYPDYEVSNSGEVKVKKTGKAKPSSLVNGHPKVKLKGKTEYISKLVAEEYIPNPEQKENVIHLDGDKKNNDISNLVWATHSEAQRHSYGELGIFAPGGAVPPKRIQVIETGEVYESIRACARGIHGCTSGIRRYLKGETKSYKGYTFKLL